VQTGLLSRLMGRAAEVKTLPVSVRYVPSVLRWEMIKSAIGSIGGLAIVIGLRPTPWIGVPIGVATVLFAAYGIQQFRRGKVQYEVTQDLLLAADGSGRRQIPWQSVDKFRLKYYAFGRKAEQGTLVLHVGGAGHRIKLDSAADEFATALFYAAQVARQRDLTLDPTTLANLEQLGL
jgi:hypothetical protein